MTSCRHLLVIILTSLKFVIHKSGACIYCHLAHDNIITSPNTTDPGQNPSTPKRQVVGTIGDPFSLDLVLRSKVLLKVNIGNIPLSNVLVHITMYHREKWVHFRKVAFLLKKSVL